MSKKLLGGWGHRTLEVGHWGGGGALVTGWNQDDPALWPWARPRGVDAGCARPVRQDRAERRTETDGRRGSGDV